MHYHIRALFYFDHLRKTSPLLVLLNLPVHVVSSTSSNDSQLNTAHTHTHARTHTRTHARTHARTHTHTHPFYGPLSRTTWVSRYKKGKTNLDFTEARDRQTESGSGIRWAICKSAPCSRQITMPTPHHSSFFTGRMPFLPPNQQRQSTKGIH